MDDLERWTEAGAWASLVRERSAQVARELGEWLAWREVARLRPLVAKRLAAAEAEARQGEKALEPLRERLADAEREAGSRWAAYERAAARRGEGEPRASELPELKAYQDTARQVSDLRRAVDQAAARVARAQSEAEGLRKAMRNLEWVERPRLELVGELGLK